MKSIKFFSIITALCIFVPSYALAGGGIEPGEGCPTEERLGYVPPPFMGDVDLTYEGGYISVNGIIPQAGNPECTLTILANPYRAASQTEWENLNPFNLRQQCLEDLFPTPGQFIVGENCEAQYKSLEFYESVAAGNIRIVNANTKRARFVVMGLE